MKSFISQKIISFVILVSFFMPYVAIAQVVHDPAHTAVSSVTAAGGGITSANSTLDILKKYGLDQVAYTLAQLLGQKMANKVINKAKGGASGDSSQDSYVKNYGEFFSGLAIQEIDKITSNLEISNNPYADDLAKTLIRNAASLTSPGKISDPLAAFNLDKIVGDGWKEFGNDANIGGLDGLLALSDPVNTNIGSALISREALGNAIADQKASETLKLTSSGIKPQGKCNTNISQYKDKINSIKANKNIIQNNKPIIASAKNEVQSKTYTEEEINNIVAANPNITDLSSLEAQVKEDAGITGAKNQNTAAGTAIAGSVKGLLEDYGGCIDELISNPTALVGEGLKISTAYALTQTKHIQGWGQIVAGVFISLFSSFVQTGLSSLGADFQSSRNNVGGSEQLIAANGQSVPWTKVPAVIVDLPGGLQDAQHNTEKEIKLMQEYILIISENKGQGTLLSNMADLDQCLPGPDYRYEKRLDPYVSAKISKMERKKTKGTDSRQEQKQDALSNINASINFAKSEMELWTQNPERNIPGANIIQSQLNLLPAIRQKYKQKSDSLLEKQSALSLLYNIETKLKQNIQLLRDYVPNLPTNFAFTDTSWNRLTAADKTTLTNWVRSIRKIPANAAQWNALTEEQKNGLLIWARSVKSSSIQPDATDQKKRDFVLSILADPALQMKFVIATTWDVWTNATNYITYKDKWTLKDPVTGTSPADDYLNGSQSLTDRQIMGKNEIRALYNSMGEKIAIPHTLDAAELDLSQIKNTIKNTKDYLDDCNTMKRLIVSRQAVATALPPEQVNPNVIEYLKANRAAFKSQEIYDAIVLPSILSLTYGQFPPNMDCNIQCRQNIELVYGDEGVVPDQYKNYQAPIAKDIWGLIAENKALCGLNIYVDKYADFFTNAILDAGKSITCDTDWYDASEKDLVSYFYGDSIL
jgi:hypothetical protein